ncbi:MAG: hypothetical protein EBQ80_06380 [Proteobacteria bacterium]|nr:hypothetical protein [Pseudomonadota bacterium]
MAGKKTTKVAVKGAKKAPKMLPKKGDVGIYSDISLGGKGGGRGRGMSASGSDVVVKREALVKKARRGGREVSEDLNKVYTARRESGRIDGEDGRGEVMRNDLYKVYNKKMNMGWGVVVRVMQGGAWFGKKGSWIPAFAGMTTHCGGDGRRVVFVRNFSWILAFAGMTELCGESWGRVELVDLKQSEGAR